MLLWPAISQADIFEPFTTTNLNPFIQVYGLPVTEAATLTNSGELAWNLQTEFANNFTNGNDGTETITIDGETYRATLMLRYGLSDRWELGIDIPYIRHDGGSLDSFIEDWHHFWGLPNGRRSDVPQDLLVYRYTQAGVDQINFVDSASGIGDVRLNLGYLLKQDENRTWSLRAGIKLPTGDAGDLTGSESTDVYGAIHLTDTEWFGKPKLRFHGRAGLLAIGDSEIFPDDVEDLVFFGSAGFAWHTWEKVSLKAQLDFQSAYYDSDLTELGDFATQIVFGGAVRLGDTTSLDISISEDIKTDSSPDVVFQLGLRSSF